MQKGRMYRPHLKWCDYDNEGNVLPMDYKRLKDGTIVDIKCMEEDAKLSGKSVEGEE